MLCMAPVSSSSIQTRAAPAAAAHHSPSDPESDAPGAAGMKYYPLFVRVAGRKCLVVGGDTVAEQKVRGLLDAHACVTVISPGLTSALQAMAERGEIDCIHRPFQPGDTAGSFIVIAATGRDDVDRQIVDDAAKSGALANVVDRPEL